MRWWWVLVPALGLHVSSDSRQGFSRDILADDFFDMNFDKVKNITVPKTVAMQLLNLVPGDDWKQAPNTSDEFPPFTKEASYGFFRPSELESYICRFPTVSELENSKTSKSHWPMSLETKHSILSRGLVLLEDLKKHQPFIQSGYFAEIFRYGKDILQVPYDQFMKNVMLGNEADDNDKEYNKNIYVLGRWIENLSHPADDSKNTSILLPLLGVSPSAFISPGRDLVYENETVYIQQIWQDGTICDLNGEPRSTIVRVCTV